MTAKTLDNTDKPIINSREKGRLEALHVAAERRNGKRLISTTDALADTLTHEEAAIPSTNISTPNQLRAKKLSRFSRGFSLFWASSTLVSIAFNPSMATLTMATIISVSLISMIALLLIDEWAATSNADPARLAA